MDSINSDLTKEIDMILHTKMDDYAALKKEQFTITEKKKSDETFWAKREPGESSNLGKTHFKI